MFVLRAPKSPHSPQERMGQEISGLLGSLAQLSLLLSHVFLQQDESHLKQWKQSLIQQWFFSLLSALK